jgi:ribosomal protein S18 acetylase RimI-like enzyme
MAAHHPQQSHYYLHALGVRSSRQGRGIGSALIRQVTAICDRDHVLAYLENSNERNLPLYVRNGFQVTTTWQVPGGPPIWFMVRTPRQRTPHNKGI